MLFRQVLAVRDKLPDLRAIVQYGEEEVEHDGVFSWEDFQVTSHDEDEFADDDDGNNSDCSKWGGGGRSWREDFQVYDYDGNSDDDYDHNDLDLNSNYMM